MKKSQARLNGLESNDKPIGCMKFDKENPEFSRCCGDILFGNKIWLCHECFLKYKDNDFWKEVITE
jgi:hypothetical protein